MSATKPFVLSPRAHRARLSEILTFRAQLRTIESQLKQLTVARQQLTVNIRYHEGQVRPRIASSLKAQGV